MAGKSGTLKLDDLIGRGGGRARDDDDEEDECALCELEQDGSTPLGDRLATAVAYGVLVIGDGHGLATCDEHQKAIKMATKAVKREIRDAEDGD